MKHVNKEEKVVGLNIDFADLHEGTQSDDCPEQLIQVCTLREFNSAFDGSIQRGWFVEELDTEPCVVLQEMIAEYETRVAELQSELIQKYGHHFEYLRGG